MPELGLRGMSNYNITKISQFFLVIKDISGTFDVAAWNRLVYFVFLQNRPFDTLLSRICVLARERIKKRGCDLALRHNPLPILKRSFACQLLEMTVEIAFGNISHFFGKVIHWDAELLCHQVLGVSDTQSYPIWTEILPDFVLKIPIKKVFCCPKFLRNLFTPIFGTCKAQLGYLTFQRKPQLFLFLRNFRIGQPGDNGVCCRCRLLYYCRDIIIDFRSIIGKTIGKPDVESDIAERE